VTVVNLIGAAGLTAGLWQSWSRPRDPSATIVHRGAQLLAGLSLVLVLLASPPPTSEARSPCLQIHHCVIIPNLPDVADASTPAPEHSAVSDPAVLPK
jgi:hypothetical protein